MSPQSNGPSAQREMPRSGHTFDREDAANALQYVLNNVHDQASRKAAASQRHGL